MNRTLTQTLTQAYFLGQGFDISGAYHIPGELLRPILDPDKVGTRTFKLSKDGQEYTIPDYVTGIVDSEGKYLTDTVETRDEFQRTFSAKASVHASAGGFSGQMEAAYSRTFSESSQYSYSLTNLYQRIALLRLDTDRASKALSQHFIDAYRALPERPTDENLPAFAAFFHDFGFYFTAELALGGTLEYYVAVHNDTKLGTESIEAKVRAEYRAVFVAGELSGEIKNDEEFKKYLAGRTINILARGGRPELLAQLIGVDPGKPSDETVQRYDRWLASIEESPAVADFQLLGVWELIPEVNKRQAVQDAFIKMLPTLRPRLTTVVSPQPGAVPSLVLGKPLTPAKPGKPVNGFQLVVLDRAKVGPAGVLSDHYYEAANSSSAAYDAMYDKIAADLDHLDLAGQSQVIIFASFGLSVHRAPTTRLARSLRSAGAGSLLEMWMEKTQPSIDPALAPLSYLLVGVPGQGTHSGVERLTTGKTLLTQEVLFYWQRDVKNYSLSAGSQSLAAADAEPAAPRPELAAAE
jgi:hypothetical protein